MEKGRRQLTVCTCIAHLACFALVSVYIYPACICDMVLGTGERHLQDDAKEAIDIASRAHKSRPQVSLEKVRKVSITDSSNTIHCSIVTSMGETCKCFF